MIRLDKVVKMTVKDSSRKLELWVRNRSDSELSRKWDWCLADAVMKRGTGLGLGHVFSLTFFERRMWPLAFVFCLFVRFFSNLYKQRSRR